jgi:hypothetical protein
MLTVDAIWDDRLRRFKYRLPGVGFAVAERGRTSIVSDNAALAREARLVAGIMRVRLPERFELLVRR